MICFPVSGRPSKCLLSFWLYPLPAGLHPKSSRLICMHIRVHTCVHVIYMYAHVEIQIYTCVHVYVYVICVVHIYVQKSESGEEGSKALSQLCSSHEKTHLRTHVHSELDRPCLQNRKWTQPSQVVGQAHCHGKRRQKLVDGQLK